MKYKMIPRVLAPLFFLLLAITTKAQAPTDFSNSNFYVTVYGGYGLLTPGSYHAAPSIVSNPTTSSSFSSNNTGLGAGLHFGGGFGYILNDFLNLGIGAEYLKGKEIVASSTYNSVTTSYYASSQTYNHTVLSIIPNITFKALSTPSYYIYNRIGILVAVSSKLDVVYKDSSNYQSGGNTYISGTHAMENYKFGLNLGVQSALGIQFNIANNLRGFVEIVGNYLPIKPTSMSETYTNSTSVNGGSPTTSTSNYAYTFKKSGSYDYNSTANSTNGSDVRANQPTVTFNVNYIGLNIGVAYKF